MKQLVITRRDGRTQTFYVDELRRSKYMMTFRLNGGTEVSVLLNEITKATLDGNVIEYAKFDGAIDLWSA